MKKRAFTQDEKAWGGYSTHSLPTRTAENLPDYVEDKVKMFKEKGYSEDKAWPIAWSIYCKYKEPNSPHCHQDTDDYFSKQASTRSPEQLKDINIIKPVLDEIQKDTSPNLFVKLIDLFVFRKEREALVLAKQEGGSKLFHLVMEGFKMLEKFNPRPAGFGHRSAGAVKDALMDILDPFLVEFEKLSPEHADHIYENLMGHDFNKARSIAKANSSLLKKVNEAIHALEKFDNLHSGKNLEQAYHKYQQQFQELSPMHWEDIRDSLLSLQPQPDPHLGIKMTPELKRLYSRAFNDVSKSVKMASEQTSSYDGIYMSQQGLSILADLSQQLSVMLNGHTHLENWVEAKIARATSDIEDVYKYLNYSPSVKTAGWAGGSFSVTLNDFKLESGEGSKLVAQGRRDEITGWDKYAMLVAEAYQAAPKSTGSGKQSVAALVDHITKMFKRINSVVDVQFVDYDPYKSAEDMQKKVKESGVLMISTLYNQADSWSPEVNLMFRTLHDFTSHLGANPQKVAWSHFTAKGELIAYNKHLALLGKDAKAIPAIFTEIVGQAMYYHHFGDFPDQKAITMDDFDPIKLGQVKGYKIVDGDLV